MQINRDKEYPYCFARLENVFPLGDDGLRHTPESCRVCIYKTECLRTAMNRAEGLTVILGTLVQEKGTAP